MFRLPPLSTVFSVCLAAVTDSHQPLLYLLPLPTGPVIVSGVGTSDLLEEVLP